MTAPPPGRRLRAVAVAVTCGLSAVAPTPAAEADAGSAINGAVALSHAAAPPVPGPPSATALPPAGAPASAPLATPTTPTTPTAPPVVAAQRAQKVTTRKVAGPAPAPTGLPFGSATGAPARNAKARANANANANAKPQRNAKPAATPFRAGGLPLPTNPTFALATVGPVPDFFIEKFRIPPVLIPMYEAAGIQYDVPWQILAAINEIESDYGRNLGVSSAGAVGWMQILPQTWAEYGVDANGDGVKDPYNPLDAIFTAGRFLHAAGASQNLRAAVFAYNNAPWFVDSVLLRAKLIGGLPAELLRSITGLTDGTFPVGGTARYADDVALAARAAGPQSTAPPAATSIYAAAGSPAVAVHDGVITAIGQSAALGRFVRLRDAYGSTYTYSQLRAIPALYAVPKPRLATAARASAAPPKPTADPAPRGPASAGNQPAGPAARLAPAAPPRATPRVATDTAAGPPRLFANRPAAATRRASISSGIERFVQTYGLRPSEAELRPLAQGAHVSAGTILGRIGAATAGRAPHLAFQIQPAGAPPIDPKPILDGWKLLASAAVYRTAAVSAPVGAASPTIGQILLESKTQLEQQVLADPSIDIYSCGRDDIQSGLIDQRILAPLAILAAAGLKPSVTALHCGSSPKTAPADAAGTGVDIGKVNGIPVLGHQARGSVADAAISRLLTLQGSFKPDEVINLLSHPAGAIAPPNHGDRIHFEFTATAPSPKPSPATAGALKPKQWLALIGRLRGLTNPSVSAQPSSAAVPVKRGR